MKKQTGIPSILFFATVAILGGCAQEQYAGGYKLNGTIAGVPSGKVKLVKNNSADRTTTTIDSAEITGGSFVMEGNVESSEMMTLTVEPGNWSVQVFMENGEITVKADTTNATHYDWTAYGGSKGATIKNFTVSGSESQEDWIKYQDDPELKAFEPEFARMQEEYKNASSNKEEAEKVRGRMDSVRTVYNALQKQWIDSFIKAKPSSPAGAYMLSNYYMFNESMPLQEMESLVGRFEGPAKTTVYYKELTDAVNQKKTLQPGKTAPDFTLKKPDSTDFKLSSLRGQYVMLDFWASWCVPCRKAIPHWKEVYKKYNSKGFEILGITNDSKWSDWFKAMDYEQMPWLQVADEFPVKNMPARVAELYMIPYLPTYVLLDKEGRIIMHNGTKQQIDEKLKEIFGS